jgi:hypothetical protein
MNPDEALNRLGARWSPDFDAYATGAIDASQVTCLMCEEAPCVCGDLFPFGSAAYMNRLNEIHGRTNR